MKLLADAEIQKLRWLVDLDLLDYRACGKSPLRELAARFENSEPWLHITAPNLRRQAIIVCLQNQLRGVALRDTQMQHDAMRKTLAESEITILQGAESQDYETAWQLWRLGDDRRLRKITEKIERKRTEWRAMCKREEMAERKARRKLHIRRTRDRASSIAMPADWFAPMPVHNQRSHFALSPAGYCQATGQDRKKVSRFLKAMKQKPFGKLENDGAGRPLPLYTFGTNLLVLDKWLGDWLLTSPHRMAEAESKPERVCGAVVQTLSNAAICEHSDEQAEQLRAVLQKHWRKWNEKVKDQARLKTDSWEAALTLGVEAWRSYRAERRARWADIRAKTRPGYKMKNGVWGQPEHPSGPMPYCDVKVAWDRFLWLQR